MIATMAHYGHRVVPNITTTTIMIRTTITVTAVVTSHYQYRGHHRQKSYRRVSLVSTAVVSIDIPITASNIFRSCGKTTRTNNRNRMWKPLQRILILITNALTPSPHKRLHDFMHSLQNLHPTPLINSECCEP